MINLYEYINSGDFFQDIPHETTIITDLIVEQPLPATIKILDIAQALKNTQALRGQLIGIAQHIGSQDILKINELIACNPPWINLQPGLESMISKNNPEENDIPVMLAHSYRVIEPINIQQLLTHLTPNNYLRVHHTFLAKELSNLKRDNGIALLGPQQLHTDIVCLTHPACADKVSAAFHALSSKEFNYDIFVQEEFSSHLNEHIIEKAKESKVLVIVLNHKATAEIWNYYQHLVDTVINDKEIAIHYIFPQYHLVQSILPEYIHQEAHFDVESFVEYLSHY